MILVTGGAGFIGSHIVDALVADGQAVRVLDSLLPAAHRRAPDYLNPGAEYVQGDVADAGVVERALEGVGAVCHQAAMVGLGQNILDIAQYARHNDLGTAVLLRALATGRAGLASGRAGVRRGAAPGRAGVRLVLASSMVVYGEGGYRCAAHGRVTPAPREAAALRAGRFEARCPECARELEPLAVGERSALDPRNVYAATKAHQEHLCFAFARETGMPVTALRYHNVYGARMPRDSPYSGVAAVFASALASGVSPRVYEDGRQLRDFVHVRDVARANVLALLADEPATGAFNVASGRPRSVGELAEALAAAAGPGAPPATVTGEFRLGDIRHVFASVERAERALGFRAREGFEAGTAEFARAPLRAG